MPPAGSKRVTIADVAALCGVSRATVSYVLNASQTKIAISRDTREKVIRAARECGYHPNAAARALSRRRAGQLGLLLSDAVDGGWRNPYYAATLAGVEGACRDHSLALSIGLYNLSNIGTFTFPASVGQCSVDGVVLTGYVEAAVVERFRAFGVPCVCIGDNLEVGEIIPAIAPDVVGGFLKAVRRLAALGHRRIGCHVEPSRRGREVIELLRVRALADPLTRDCTIEMIDPRLPTDLRGGRALFEHWRGLPEDTRPTAYISNDHVLGAFLRELRRAGLSCPRDVGLICNCDTVLCELADPRLSALHQDFTALGSLAVHMLYEHIEGRQPLVPAMSRNDCAYDLVVRESCGVSGGCTYDVKEL